MGTQRLFVAVDPGDAVRAAVEALLVRLRHRVPRRAVRWVDPALMHVTLKFLGDTPDERLPAVRDALTRALDGVTMLEARVTGTGCFPPRGAPRVAWVAVREDAAESAVGALAARVDAAMTALGYPPEDRAFHPHLTLGRVARDVRGGAAARVRAAVDEVADFDAGPLVVREVALVRSVLSASGPVYTVIHRVALAAPR
ncbi:MAG: RNA 2',3'-cyclic phosphodiesterase [Deltaproteobacteria bacterium]|nr:RNA 2',3'-cyclic phosphodiesterase [Deltaproteobacteria bacterium]